MKNKPLFVIDLDRTLIDTDRIVFELVKALNDQGHDGDSVVDKIEKARLAEEDLNAYELINSLGSEVWAATESYLLKEADKQSFVFDDAQLLIKSLMSAEVQYIILTFGVSREWQELKLKLAGLKGTSAIITDSRLKSSVINSWLDETGLFSPTGFPELASDNIVLIDDRPDAFADLPPGRSVGYLINRSASSNPEDLPPGKFQVIASLDQIKL